jgi:hypothetical protein
MQTMSSKLFGGDNARAAERVLALTTSYAVRFDPVAFQGSIRSPTSGDSPRRRDGK